MRKTMLFTIALIVAASILRGDWDDDGARGFIPFWVNSGDFYTLLVLVNGDEDTPDVIRIRLCDHNGNYCSDTTVDRIGPDELLVFSTQEATPTWIPTKADYGYILFRADEGSGFIQAWALIYNRHSGVAMAVPSYNQGRGF
ncbi:MAG: hypothetical protein JW941_00665 [Candidatus Coatesbacteria bacterium]|nr:hypothetical protein [Candidatus Coatesbacteria bacterium]